MVSSPLSGGQHLVQRLLPFCASSAVQAPAFMCVENDHRRPPRLRIARFMSSTLTGWAGGLCIPPNSDASMLADSTVTTQVFRLKAEGYTLSRKARIKPFNTFSVSTTLGSSRNESSLRKKPTRFDKFN